jgi:hypothetical protein
LYARAEDIISPTTTLRQQSIQNSAALTFVVRNYFDIGKSVNKKFITAANLLEPNMEKITMGNY